MNETPIYELPLADLRGGHHAARVGSQEIVIVETDQGVRVYDGVCPHLGGPLLEARISRRAIICPWHRYAFDAVSGECRTLPGTVWGPTCSEAGSDGPMRIALRPLRHAIEDRVIRVYAS